jgi:hypothetical protein
MHSTCIKITAVQEAEIYSCKNNRLKLLKSNAAIWFNNNMWRPIYIYIYICVCVCVCVFVFVFVFVLCEAS